MYVLGLVLMALCIPLFIVGILTGPKRVGLVLIGIVVTFVPGCILVSNAVEDRCVAKGGAGVTRGICFTEDGRRVK